MPIFKRKCDSDDESENESKITKKNKNSNGKKREIDVTPDNIFDTTVDDIIGTVEVPISGIKDVEAVNKRMRNKRYASQYKTFGGDTYKLAIQSPGIYIGGYIPVQRSVQVYDFKKKQIIQKYVTLPESCSKFVEEMMGNIADNIDLSRRSNYPLGKVEVKTNKLWIEFYSQGSPFLVAPMPGYTSETFDTTTRNMFGVWGSSDKYNKNIHRSSAGMNGCGAKGVNTFSLKTKLEIGDPETGVVHEIIWKNNMTEIEKNEITPNFIYGKTKVVDEDEDGNEYTKEIYTWYPDPSKKKYKGEAYVKISYMIDFDFFNYGLIENDKVIEHGYQSVDHELFAKICLDTCFTSHIPITFNGELLDYTTISKNASLYFPDGKLPDNHLIYYEYDHNDYDHMTTNQISKMLECPTDIKQIPRAEVLLIDNPKNGFKHAYANGIYNCDGGEHYEACMEDFGRPVIDIVNTGKFKKKEKNEKDKKKEDIEKLRKKFITANKKSSGKQKKDEEKEKKKNHITIKHVKDNLTCFVIYRGLNPTFNGQIKNKLTGFKDIKSSIKFNVTDQHIKEMMNWNWVNVLKEETQIKEYKEILGEGTSGKKVRLSGGKGRPANLAGRRPDLCNLNITEGKSGGEYMNYIIKLMLNGLDTEGSLGLRGKLLNISKIDIKNLLKNEEIVSIIKMLGLELGVDYSIDENFNKLNYHKVTIVADADDDGAHITGLIINFFNKLFPSLLERDFLYHLMTPIIRAFKKKGNKNVCVAKFINQDSCDQWKEINGTRGIKFKYYKGLGSSNKECATDDLLGDDPSPNISFKIDKESSELISTLFEKNIKKRKKWIQKMKSEKVDLKLYDIKKIINGPFKSIKQIEGRKYRDITNFFECDLLRFILTALRRAIPDQRDGLKKVHRQVIDTILREYNWGNNDKDAMKVFKLAAKISEAVDYDHGPVSLEETIFKLGQDYVGANNLPFLHADGMFGSRDKLGKDHAQSRYPGASPSEWVKYVFYKDLHELIERNTNDDGDKTESKTIPSIVPTLLINGKSGVSFGYASKIPPHNPFDICEAIYKLNNGEEINELIPYFKGFTGDVKVIKPWDKIRNKELKDKANIRAKESAKTNYEKTINSADQDFISDEETDEESNDEEYEKDNEENDENDEEEDEENEEEDDTDRDHKNRTEAKGFRVETTGIYNILKEKIVNDIKICDIEVLEIPIGRSLNEYENKMVKMAEKGHLTSIEPKTYIDRKTNIEHIKFIIRDFNHEDGINHRTLKLKSSFPLSNQTLLDENGHPRRFENCNEILKTYHEYMISVFELYISTSKTNLANEIKQYEDKINFINLVKDNIIKLGKMSDEEIDKILLENNIIPENVEKLGYKQCTPKYKEKLLLDLDKTLEQQKFMINNTPQKEWNSRLDIFVNYLEKINYPKRIVKNKIKFVSKSTI